MKAKKRIGKAITNNKKRLSFVASLLLTLGLFILIGQNILLSWFMDNEALSLLAQNYSMSFKMAYTPFVHLIKAEQILSERLDNSDSVQILLDLFADSNYFSEVKLVDAQASDITLDDGQVVWQGIDLINNEPQLALLYKFNNSNDEQLLSVHIPLPSVIISNLHVEGYSIIHDSKGNSIATALNEPEWHLYEALLPDIISMESKQPSLFLPQTPFENPLRRNIGSEVYGFIRDTFTLDGTSYTIDLFIDENSINRNGQAILLTLMILFSFFGFVLFIVIIFASPERLQMTDEEKIKKLISQGENETTEFKSSLRWDYKNNIVNRDLEKVIIKSIAAFSNAGGGKLLIGVQDDGSIIGIDNDYHTLKNPNADFFELHLRNIIDKELGQDFCASQIKCNFYSLNNTENEKTDIVVVSITEGDEPVYVNNENKGEVFYVRSGNSSRKIENLSELMRYIKKRF